MHQMGYIFRDLSFLTGYARWFETNESDKNKGHSFVRHSRAGLQPRPISDREVLLGHSSRLIGTRQQGGPRAAEKTIVRPKFSYHVPWSFSLACCSTAPAKIC